MEFKLVVYNSARDGKLNRLKVFLSQRDHLDISALVNSETSGVTPLIASCRNGHLDVVQYLVEECKADIEQTGCVTFDGETINGAPPLWCAAAAGHLHIVSYLVYNVGSNVNSTTLTNSTPLRAACFDGHLSIVQFLVQHGADVEIANRHGHTCLMIACYKGQLDIVSYLIDNNAEINRKSIKGNTAMHDCAESGSLKIMQLLLAHGAKMQIDSYNMTPLLAAAVTGNAEIVEFLISRDECSTLEKIDALELLGATYVDRKRDILGALSYWRHAMNVRYGDNENITEKSINAITVPAYENAIEVKTLLQLDKLVDNPDAIRMQALLMRERILGPAHPDTSYYIRYRGAVYADNGNFDKCINLWMYALDIQQSYLEPLNPMTQSSFLSFVELFSFIMSDNYQLLYTVKIKDLLLVLKKSADEYHKTISLFHHKNIVQEVMDETINNLIMTILNLIGLICYKLPLMTQQESIDLKQICCQLVKNKCNSLKRTTPLHLACTRDTSAISRYAVCSFPSIQVASILIEVGASVNAIDTNYNTPLHIAVAEKTCKVDLINMLLNNGAHIDAKNSDNKDVSAILKELGKPIHTIGICSLDFLTLQCLAARKIVKYKIDYKYDVPVRLIPFIEMH